MALILWRVLPLIGRVIVSVLPVGFGFLLLAYTLWADQIPRFATLDLTFNTLFAFLNGDVVLDILHVVAFNLGPWAYLIMVSFFCLFTYVVLNICLVCVEFALEQFGAYLAAVAIQKELELAKTRPEVPSPRAQKGGGKGHGSNGNDGNGNGSIFGRCQGFA